MNQEKSHTNRRHTQAPSQKERPPGRMCLVPSLQDREREPHTSKASRDAEKYSMWGLQAVRSNSFSKTSCYAQRPVPPDLSVDFINISL